MQGFFNLEAIRASSMSVSLITTMQTLTQMVQNQ